MIGEKRLRCWLAKQLRLDDVPGNIWDDLVEMENVEDVLGGGDKQALLQRARTLQRRFRSVGAMSHAGSRPAKRLVPPDGTDVSTDELNRAVVLAAYLEHEIAGLASVRRFRATWLGGRELSEEEVQAFLTSPGAARDELQVLADKLNRWYPLVDGSDSQRFILTGGLTAGRPKPPLVVPVNVFSGRLTPLELRSETTIVMEIIPWVSAETVAKWYRLAQKALLERKNRPASRRNLSVALHVLMHWPAGSVRPTWAQLMARWNREYPEWSYGGDYRRFRRDYHRGLDSVFAVRGDSPKPTKAEIEAWQRDPNSAYNKLLNYGNDSEHEGLPRYNTAEVELTEG